MMRYWFIVFAIALGSLTGVSLGQQSEPVSKKKITISGIVTDVNKQPVVGAIILIDKIKTNSVTNRKGYYKVKTLPGAGVISVFTRDTIVSEVPIEGRILINFTVKRLPSSEKISQRETGNEDDVNIGYGTVKQKNLGTSVNKLNTDNRKSPSYSDIYQMLSGKVPGVVVSGKSIKIRGTNSITLSGEPLFVVDNIAVSTIDNINPNDVKSIEVLKGAAASIYGSRGTNGVIMINLKNGTENK